MVRGEVLRPRTALPWLLARWVVGESEEAGHRTLSSHGPENPEEKEIALSLSKWVPLALEPAAEQKQKETQHSPPGPPEKEQTLSGPLLQGRFVDFLDDLEPGWDVGGAALLREARCAGLDVDSTWGGAALEDAGGRPQRRADWGLLPGAALFSASHRGRMCWIASVCCCTAVNCWAKPSTVSPNSPAWEMGASRKRALSKSLRTVPPSGDVRSLHLGNARVPPGSPAIEGSEVGGDGRAASGCERGHPRLCQLLMHLQDKRYWSRTRLWATPRSEKPT